MRCVIGARFKDVGKIYYFSCEEFEVKVGEVLSIVSVL